MRSIPALLVIFILWNSAVAQSPLDNARVNGSFQVDAQFYRPDEAIGITDSTIAGRKIGINGFGNFKYTLGNFSAGMRYEAYLGPIAGFDPQHEGNGFANIWASYQTEMVELTAGNFYEQFGNGLVLRAYEEWALGYDNSLNGIRAVYRPIRGLTIKGVYGTQRYYWQRFERNNRGTVRGTDAELDVNEVFGSMHEAKARIILGASAVSKYQRDADPIYNLPENVGAFAGRMNVSIGKFSFMSEYANKINDPSVLNNYIYKEGQAFLTSLSYAERGLGVILQLKRVDNMHFKSDRGTTSNALDISFIPPINRTHAYSLTGKYPYATQANGEMGLQFQLNYRIPRGSKLGGQFGTNIAINYSQVNDIKRIAVNDTTAIFEDGTLGYKSKFFEASDHVFFRDFNIEVDKRFSRTWRAVFQYMNLHYDIATIEGKTGADAVKANIALADVTWRMTTRNSLKLEVQTLFTKQDKGDWAAVMVEYAIAPRWFFTLADQYNYGNTDTDKRKHYYTASMGYTREATRLAVSFGRQAEGVVCVGGVCRVVPASSGLSLTLTSNF
jgi:hypothetical protein